MDKVPDVLGEKSAQRVWLAGFPATERTVRAGEKSHWGCLQVHQLPSLFYMKTVLESVNYPNTTFELDCYLYSTSS